METILQVSETMLAMSAYDLGLLHIAAACPVGLGFVYFS